MGDGGSDMGVGVKVAVGEGSGVGGSGVFAAGGSFFTNCPAARELAEAMGEEYRVISSASFAADLSDVRLRSLMTNPLVDASLMLETKSTN